MSTLTVLSCVRRLTNTVTLLHLLNKNTKPANNTNKARPVANAARNMFSGIFSSRPTPLAHAEASIHGGGVGE